MKFKIADKFVKHKYRGPIFIALLWPVLISAGSILLGGTIPLEPVFYAFCFSCFAALLNFRGGHAFRKYAAQHSVEITPEGMISHEPDTTETMPWGNVKSVIVKGSSQRIKSLKLLTNNGASADLSRYADLELLCTELEKYVAAEQWQYRGYKK
ncbi:hypothetical protein ACRZ5S_14980 [Vibrio scophthalmi]|uniref:hypothetical protein n=1 Tax=Vibrio scophthalmi TaxID=45658 RepID=UPI003AAC089E